jgi:hypothetical protein
MPNFGIPNPAQQSDVIAALLASLNSQPVNPMNVGITPLPAGSTNYTYAVIAKFNGQVLPVLASITNGPAALSVTSSNTVAWSPLVPPTGISNTQITYDVYRTVGGTTQGKIASAISLLSPTGNTVASNFVDTGIAGDGTVAPAFSTIGVIASGQIDAVSFVTANGAIAIATGKAMITAGSALTTLTLPAALAGNFANGGIDGAELVIYSETAFAHVVTAPVNAIAPGNKHILTFAATAGSYVTLYAAGGFWWVGPLSGVTVS